MAKEARYEAKLSRAFHRMARNLAPKIADAFGLATKAEGTDEDMNAKLQALVDAEDWDGLEALMGEEGLEIYMLGTQSAAKQLSATDAMLSLANDKAIAWAESNAGKKITAISESTRDSIKATVTKATEEGWSSARLADAIQDDWAFSASRCEMIARTEGAFADMQGNVELYRQSGQVAKLEFLNADTNPCEDCEALDGQEFDLDDEENTPPIHPSCFLPGTVVSAAGVSAQFAHRFDGEILRISIEGQDEIAITPNHPVLTRRGWIASNELHEGDDLFRVSDPATFVRLCNPDDNHAETRIEDMAEALLVAGGMLSISVPKAAEDFHGDSIPGENVHIVRANGDLSSTSDSSVCEHGNHSRFLITDTEFATFARECPLDLLPMSLNASTGGIVSLNGTGSPDSGIGTGSLQSISLGDVADSKSMALPCSSQSSAGTTDGFGNIGATLPSQIPKVQFRQLGRAESGSDIQSLPLGSDVNAVFSQNSNDDLVSDSQLAGQRSRILSAFIATAKVLKIERINFEGHVYNLETEGGWYVAGSILAHNCRCTSIPVLTVEEE